ncbi:reverse transcriptase [Gossypium australe]|uniref:Reverse transcriptase n=1 Tax=Gossypium australe TaxID=47621 RepID=A0A5B6W7X6_9ROSI|nr:reverse transcriptase [Gossypium australe]
MCPLKASGEDVGGDVVRFCIAILKGENPRNMFHFKPIILCNAIYKVASKVLVNRFQEVLHLCIDEV